MLKNFLILSFFLIIVSACSQDYQVNSCIQKADSMDIWKVIENDGEKSIELQNGANIGQITPLIGSDWIKTECP